MINKTNQKKPAQRNDQKNTFIEVGALWLKQDRNGNDFLIGSAGKEGYEKKDGTEVPSIALWAVWPDGTSKQLNGIMVQTNSNKKSDKAPDYHVKGIVEE